VAQVLSKRQLKSRAARTIHLVSARDRAAIAPVTGDVLARTFKSQFSRRLPVPGETVAAAGSCCASSRARAPSWPRCSARPGHARTAAVPGCRSRAGAGSARCSSTASTAPTGAGGGTLTIDRFVAAADDPPGTREAIEAEGTRLIGLISPGADQDVDVVG
jgi:hypothetical protein